MHLCMNVYVIHSMYCLFLPKWERWHTCGLTMCFLHTLTLLYKRLSISSKRFLLVFGSGGLLLLCVVGRISRDAADADLRLPVSSSGTEWRARTHSIFTRPPGRVASLSPLCR